MKLTFKFIKWLISLVIIVLVVLCVVLYIFGGHMLKVGIETAATKTLNVGVDIDDLDLSVLKGKVELENLIVKNPPGYAHENLLGLGKVSVTASLRSLLSDTVQIREIKLNGMDLVIEQKGLSNNLQDVIGSISAKDKQESEPAGKKLHIDELEITDVKVKVKLLPIPGKADTISLKLSPIKMTNLGTDNKLDVGVLTSKILLAVAESVAEQGVGLLPKDFVNTMKSTLDKTTDIGKSAVKEGEKILEKGTDAGKELIEGVKGLLKPKKDE